MKKRNMVIIAAAAAVLAAGALLSACGGGDTQETQTEAQTTEEETAEEETAEEETAQETTEEETSQETEEELTVTGKIVAAGMSSITIRTEDGEETSYLKEGTEVDMEGDQVEGTMVTITYVERDGMNYALRITDAQ